MAHRRILILSCTAMALCLGAGCRNSCNSGLVNPFTSSSRIAAPPTYSFQVPNGGAPYYGASSASAPGGAVPAAPASYPGSNSQPPQWQPAGSQNPTQFSLPNSTSAPFSMGGGFSQVVSNNYNTTPVDVRNDPTRVALVDASRVAAPGGLAVQSNPNPLAQALFNGVQPYTPPAANFIPGEVRFQGQLTRHGASNPAANPYAGMPAPQPNQPQVLAQGSTLSQQNNPNWQNGWYSTQQTAGQPATNR